MGLLSLVKKNFFFLLVNESKISRDEGGDGIREREYRGDERGNLGALEEMRKRENRELEDKNIFFLIFR